ncbi:Rep [Chicken proventriculitis-associated circular virus 27]|nr:Rep [Chicken proventriculitis-associated circular virus 27]
MAFTDSKGFIRAGRKPKRTTRAYVKKKLGGKRMRKTVKAIVKKELSKENETKFIQEDVLPAGTLFNSVINTNNDWYRALPKFAFAGSAEGTGSANRIGNRITPRSVISRWAVSFAQTDEASRDITVFLYLLQPLFFKTYPVETAGGQNPLGFNNFLRSGSELSYAQGFNGTWGGSTRPVDNNQYKILMVKKFRLNKPSGAPQGVGVVGAGGRGMYSVGDMEWRKEITYKHRNLPATFKYAGPSNKLPENCAPIWALGYYYNDNSNPDTDVGLLRVEYTAAMYYDDS